MNPFLTPKLGQSNPVCRSTSPAKKVGVNRHFHASWTLQPTGCLLQLEAFMDIRLRPGIATPLLPYGPLRPNMMSSIKLEVHSILQRRQNRTKPWPQATCTQNFVQICPVVPEICSRTDIHTQTDRRVDHNIPHPFRGRVIIMWCWIDCTVVGVAARSRAGRAVVEVSCR